MLIESFTNHLLSYRLKKDTSVNPKLFLDSLSKDIISEDMEAKYLILGFLLILIAPYLFSYGMALEKTGHYIRRHEGGPSEWEPGLSHLGIAIEFVAAVSVWVGVPFLIYGQVAHYKLHLLKGELPAIKEAIFSIAVLIWGCITIQCTTNLCLWFELGVGIVLDESFVTFWGIVGIVAGGVSIIIMLIVWTYTNASLIHVFLKNLTPVKRIYTQLTKTDFHIVIYEEKYRLLVRKIRLLKLVFRIFFMSVIFVSLYVLYLNLVNLVNIFLHFSIGDLFSFLQQTVSFYLFSLAPLSIVLVYGGSLFFEFFTPKERFLEAKEDRFVRLVIRSASSLGLVVPKVMYRTDVSTLSAVNYKRDRWIIANPQFVKILIQSCPSELEAAVVHELRHFMNGDVEDRTRMFNILFSLETASGSLMRILIPLFLTLPFSIIILPWPTFLIPLTFLVFVFFVKLLEEGVHAVLIAPFLVSLVAGLLFIPLAVYWGKLNSLMEKRADIEAANSLESSQYLASMLQRLQSAANITPMDVVNQKKEEIGSIIERERWQGYFFSIPAIILSGIFQYYQRYYLNIDSRLENLQTSESKEVTWKTTLRRTILSIYNFFSDIISNEDSRVAFFFGLLLSPFIFMYVYFTHLGNFVTCIIYTIVILIIISKIAKYAVELSRLLES